MIEIVRYVSCRRLDIIDCQVFWYPSRIIATTDKGLSYRTDRFLAGTSFEKTYDLYLFDKKLRLLMIDAIERIEIHVRSVIAHEVGRNDPLAYMSSKYINPKFSSAFEHWVYKQKVKLDESRDDCIEWHRSQGKEIPFWVAVETRDFGQMSKYYAMLNGHMQGKLYVVLALIISRHLQNG